MLRSIRAILSGFLIIALFATGVGMALRLLVPDPFVARGLRGLPVMIFVQMYGAAITIGAGYLTTRLAPASPLRHVIILGTLVLLVNLAVSALSWDTAPLWYHAATLALTVPCVWLGMRMHETRRQRKAAERTVLIVWRP